MEFPRFSLKNRSSKHSLKHVSKAVPNIVPDSAESVVARKAASRIKLPSMANENEMRRLTVTKGNAFLPMSPTLSEDGIAMGEPLIHDFATRTIPEEYRPITASHPDRVGEDFIRQESFSTIFSDDETFVASPKIPKRDTSLHVPIRTGLSGVQAYKTQEPEYKSPRDQDHNILSANQDPSVPRELESNKSRSSLHPNRLEQERDRQREKEQNSREHESSKSREQELAISTSSSPDWRIASSAASVKSYETSASSVHILSPLQTKAHTNDEQRLQPVQEDDPKSFDLIEAIPCGADHEIFSLEQRSEEMMSREHLEEIFKEPSLLLQFTNFLSTVRPQSIPLLVYYLDALKALRAINYANAVAEALEPLQGYDFSRVPVRPTANAWMEDRAKQAFDALVRDDLPAFVTQTFIQVVSVSIQRRVCGNLPPHLREASEGLAEVFCLSDPSRPDNPVVFASEEFHRTSQYGVNYAIGRNCRFLQGPRTNKHSIARLGKAVREGREVCEVFLNYRRDGSPFVNLLMVAPLLDSLGKIRYFVGAQVDVSGLCKDCTNLRGLQTMLARREAAKNSETGDTADEEFEEDEFQKLSEILSPFELDTVRRHGGAMHQEQIDEVEDGSGKRFDRPRLLLKDPSPNLHDTYTSSLKASGKLEGVYQNYLLIRPYPSLRILFSSPSLRVPGILQSPFMSRIGGSSRVRDELTAALAEGRGVTAKVRWISGRHSDEEGRVRWIHCTPLLGQAGAIGVWMIVILDDEATQPMRRFRTAPPVSSSIGHGSNRSSRLAAENGSGRHASRGSGDDLDGSIADGSLQSFAIV